MAGSAVLIMLTPSAPQRIPMSRGSIVGRRPGAGALGGAGGRVVMIPLWVRATMDTSMHNLGQY